MSLDCALSFTVNSQQGAWARIFDLMAQGVVGARLQDEFDVFGQQAADTLENILEEHASVLLMCEEYHVDGGRISANFEWSRSDEDFVRAFIKLLKICGAEDVELRTFDLSGD